MLYLFIVNLVFNSIILPTLLHCKWCMTKPYITDELQPKFNNMFQWQILKFQQTVFCHEVLVNIFNKLIVFIYLFFHLLCIFTCKKLVLLFRCIGLMNVLKTNISRLVSVSDLSTVSELWGRMIGVWYNWISNHTAMWRLLSRVKLSPINILCGLLCAC